MTILLPSCERVTALLTDFEEGSLGPFDWLGLKFHLSLCPPCRAFFDAMLQAPALARRAWDEEPAPQAEQALAGALAALREGRVPRGPQHHPDPEAWAALNPGGDPCLSLMLRAHLGCCESCCEAQGRDQAIHAGSNPLESLKPHLPPERQWRWVKRGLGGGRVAIVQEDASGASLSLACLPGGLSTPSHDHIGWEHVVILCGALQDGPAHLHPGDWIDHAPGTQHGPTADPGGECWALVSNERPIRFHGWRKAFRLFS